MGGLTEEMIVHVAVIISCNVFYWLNHKDFSFPTAYDISMNLRITVVTYQKLPPWTDSPNVNEVKSQGYSGNLKKVQDLFVFVYQDPH